MSDKAQALTNLKDEFERWETLLAGLSDEQVVARNLPADLSIKDVLAHLMAWQQVSIARLEAAQLSREPVMPAWAAGMADPDLDNADVFNSRIHEAYRDWPWSRVHQAWRDGFVRFLKLGEAIPESDLADTAKYPWLNGYSLLAVLQGSYEHHHVEHLEPLLPWFHERHA